MSNCNKSPTLYWDGFECGEISQFLGHEDWAHKKGTLIVKNPNNLAFIAKNTELELDDNGCAIDKMQGAKVDDTILSSAKKIFN